MESDSLSKCDEEILRVYCNSVNTQMIDKKIVSPIEQTLFLSLVTADHVFSLKYKQYENIEIIPQFKIGKYRVDFLIKGYGGELVVECDSQEWHERTEPQRRYEKERDRYIQSEGYRIFRYTGKEIIENVFNITFEIFRAVKPNLKVKSNATT